MFPVPVPLLPQLATLAVRVAGATEAKQDVSSVQ